jgi:phosphoglycolate phosphatase-like HAD superfamily hydrolase
MSSAKIHTFRGRVQIRPGFVSQPGLSHVLFDFDGTLSLIRQGWPDIMVPMFADLLPPLPQESDEARHQLAFEDIMRLNGKQTIFQMIQLADRIRERGGSPKDPLEYKHEYLRRLDARIATRHAGLKDGSLKPDDLLVHGTRALLDQLQALGLPMYLASGTDEPFVKAEADLLDLTRYFNGHIYGAQDDFKKFSKKMVISRILKENDIPGGALLAFGDGYVEIENTKEIGGTAVAVASDEANNGSGDFDEWKRERLMGVGADVCIPDYRDLEPLFDLLMLSRR